MFYTVTGIDKIRSMYSETLSNFDKAVCDEHKSVSDDPNCRKKLAFQRCRKTTSFWSIDFFRIFFLFFGFVKCWLYRNRYEPLLKSMVKYVYIVCDAILCMYLVCLRLPLKHVWDDPFVIPKKRVIPNGSMRWYIVEWEIYIS